jgi:uncharacterized protein YjbI with pentapeptide repeats
LCARDGASAGATIVEANMSGATLADADLRGATLSSVNLTDADLFGANLSEVTLRGVQFDQARLPVATMVGTEIEVADFTGASVSGLAVQDATLRGAVFTRARGNIRIAFSNLTGRADPESGNYYIPNSFIGADLRDSQFLDSDLRGVNFTGSDLRNADLSGSNVRTALFDDADMRGVTLPDYVRFDEWWKRGENLYLENFAAAGFSVIDSADLHPGDCFLMQVASPVPNHAAVYLGDDMILHHLQGRLSSRDVYGGYWQKNTTHILRYGHSHSSW